MGEGREAQEGGTIGIITADLHCGMAETSTTLKAIFPQLKIKFKSLGWGLRACLLPFSQEKQGPEQSGMTCVDRKWGATFVERCPTTENAASKLFKFGLQGLFHDPRVLPASV